MQHIFDYITNYFIQRQFLFKIYFDKHNFLFDYTLDAT